VGADNLFDVYPDRGALNISGGTVGNRGVSPYSTSSPFGFNGRFAYGRLSIYL
jgi:iron complex outermembrane receptor protein